MARRLPDGTDQTVVVDWQYAGVRPIGEDIAGLIAEAEVELLHKRVLRYRWVASAENGTAGFRPLGERADLSVAG